MAVSIATDEMRKAGQSPWLDYISREILRNGKLKSLIEESGLRGVTSNPTIFEKAISARESGYLKDIERYIREGKSTFEIYDCLTLADIRETCDLFLPVFRASQGEHGFVSLEVMPCLAHDEEATVTEALRLFKAVNRPNVMIKVPATAEGIPAIRRLIGQGVNINITLMFSLRHYRDVAGAYLEGLRDFRARGGDLSEVHSVASIFVSRIDSWVDKKLQAFREGEADPGRGNNFQSLEGKAAVANSKWIYQEFKKVFSSETFHILKAQGARVQKPLWGSTSTKNPNYLDLIYVENLVGRDTVNTMPLATLEALLDHGKVRPDSVEEGLEEAEGVIRRLKSLGIDLDEVGEKLQREGVKAFSDSFDALMGTLEKIRWTSSHARRRPSPPVQITGVEDGDAIDQKAAELDGLDFINRFFKKDPSLWKKDPGKISERLGWLDAVDWMWGKLYEIERLTEEVRSEGIRDIVLLGMGGSSLAPEVLDLIFKKAGKGKIHRRGGRRPPARRLHVLDSTVPSDILRVEKAIDPASALFIVASKSGTTVETVSAMRYFYGRLEKKILRKKSEDARQAIGRHFIAITDEGSWLQQAAAEKRFRKVYLNPSNIGGRYSALSFFGLVPAALAGVPVREVLWRAQEFLNACQKNAKVKENSPFYLGVVLGQWARYGKDKLHLWMSSSLLSFGSWLEQLIAESTGKEGKGILPVEDGGIGELFPESKDHAFALLKLKGDSLSRLSRKIGRVQRARRPVIEINWPDAENIGAEFLRWEIATCVAGMILDINPFDEPNVTESKEITGRLLSAMGGKKSLPVPKEMLHLSHSAPVLRDALREFFSKLEAVGYVALLAYTGRTRRAADLLEGIQGRLARALKVPVVYGFGPRYLHSIGQFYKGGTATGLFIELITSDGSDREIPGVKYGFSALKWAQALGDYEALKSKGRPVLMVNLGRDAVSGLSRFQRLLGAFLAANYG